MEEAVTAAWGHAMRGDIILLSPGGASFNLFRDEFDRGKKFVKAVKMLYSRRSRP
jgi:UDP-N-acetylmuramoylalanine--D-glutamate ligase